MSIPNAVSLFLYAFHNREIFQIPIFTVSPPHITEITEIASHSCDICDTVIWYL
jgi:hypothetical protein